MDIEKEASALWKKLEQIKFKLDNPYLTSTKRAQLEDQVDAINAQLKAFEQQLTQKSRGQHTSEASITDAKGKAFPGRMPWENHSMNCLTWPTDCKENIQWVGQGKGPLAAKSSAALNKYLKSIMSIKYTEIPSLLIQNK